MYHHARRRNAIGSTMTKGRGVDHLTAALGKISIDGSPNSDVQGRGSDEYEKTQLQKELDLMFDKQAREKLDGVPRLDMPSQFRDGLTLYDHQKEGISWLVHQERSGGADGLFIETTGVNGEKSWTCKISDERQNEPPKRAKGAILADDMGLGKTIQTLGLILSNPPPNRIYRAEGGRNPLAPVNLDEPVCTLIVCPVSVMTNWVEQINAHVKDGVLRAEIYAGSDRASLIPKLKNNMIDVLIVSYDTLRSDYTNRNGAENTKGGKKGKGKKAKGNKQTLFDTTYHRLILDEAQTIRTSTTGFFASTSALKAKNKTCLTGTPFVNRPDDIHSLLSFLELQPLNNKDIFRQYVTLPIQQGNKTDGLARLRMAMAQIALRRTKKASKINMVGKEHHIRRIDFPEGDHKNIHDVLYYTAQAAFGAVVRHEDWDAPEATPLTAMFEMVLRVRQACCSGELVPKQRYITAAEIATDLQKSGGELTAAEGFRMLQALQGIAVVIEDDDDFVTGDDAVEYETDEDDSKSETNENNPAETRRPIRKAAKNHMIYKMPAEESDSDDGVKSDSDSDASSVKSDDVSEASYEDSVYSDEELDSDLEPTPKKKPAKKRVPAVTCNIIQTAPKIDALLQVINEMGSDEKAVVFSQFTTFLNRIEKALNKAGHTFTRIDGSMSTTSRLDAMHEFSKEDVKKSPRFMLCSLRAAGTGINLTRANVAIMCDPWWNKAVEAQAMDRVHRLGQKRRVRVYSLVMKDSIEERMIALQKAKAALGKGSMERLSPREERRAKLTAMKDLFEIVDVEDFYDSEDDIAGASFVDEASSSDEEFMNDNESIKEAPLDASTDDQESPRRNFLDESSDSSDEELFRSVFS